MPKIKLTKGELKRQREDLAQFEHYLPTLQLKKQQSQIKILQARQTLMDLENDLKESQRFIQKWVGLLADPAIDISRWVMPMTIMVGKTNVAGASIPFFQDIRFEESDYDYYETPFWIDEAIRRLREWMTILSKIDIQKKQMDLLQKELRVTTQRVNLFEKVKIPDCIENIRVIRIYLGDQMSNAVGISKVAKKKIEAALQGADA